MTRLGLAAICLSFFAALSFAQNDRGTITGTVSDPVNAVVPNAKLTLRNLENGSVDETVTTGTGNYTIPSVTAGSYELTVEAPGFSTFVQKGIRIQVAQTARVDVNLKIGATGERVTITADAAILKTESAEQSSTISRENLLNLPINFSAVAGGAVRNPLSFVMLTPGGWYQPSNPSTSNTNVVRVNGQPNTSFQLMIDGQDATNPNATNLSGHNPSVDAVEEFTLQTSNFAAEFGQVQGGLFNFTTRSGTNQYHGAAYEYFANTALNAATPFTGVLPAVHKNDLGFTVGGPVRIPKVYNGRNRTFFFFSYEYYIDRKQGTATATVPTAAMRNGDFSSVLTGRTLATIQNMAVKENAIYDPASNFTMGGAIFRTPFGNNIIPQNRMDPVAVKIQALIPQPGNSNATNNRLIVYPFPADQMIPSIKADHSFNDKSKISFYFQDYWSHIYSNPGPDGLPVPLTSDRYKYPYSFTERLNYDQSLTPHLLFHAGVGQQRYNNNDFPTPENLDFNQVTQLGLVGAVTSGFPRITGLNGSLGGMSTNMGPATRTNILTDKWTGVLNTTYIRSSHAYKLGGEWKMDKYTDINLNGATGNYAFSASSTGLPATQGVSLGGGSVGYSYASFLLGAVNNASVTGQEDQRFSRQAWALYIQDDWKINRKLTLNYGIRWDLEQQAHETHARNSNFSPSLANPSAGGLHGAEIYEGNGPGRCNCRFVPTYPYAVGPRLGVAYQITPKTVFRGGWGLVYGAVAKFNYLDFAGTVGVGYNTINFVNPAFDEPALYLRNGLQYSTADLYKVTLDPGAKPEPGTINSPPVYLDRNGGRPPRINQWNLSLQRQITKDLAIEAAYVGSRSVWYEANGLVALNAISTARYATLGLDITNPTTQSLLSSTFDSGKPQAAGYKIPYAGFPTSQTLAQSLRPFPQFGNITSRWAPLGNSWYDALQSKITQRYSHGVTAQVAFTWQKELTSGAEGGSVNDVFNLRNQKSLSANSMPFELATGFTYELPRLTDNRFVQNTIHGWAVGGTLRYASGQPIQVPGANNVLSAYTFQSTYANRVPGVPLFTQDLNCHCFDPNKVFVLNPAAWSNPANGVFGAAPRYYDDYRAQRRYDEELSLARTFRIREKISFMIRGEFFNVFNRTYMNNPVSTNAQATQSSPAGVPVSGFGMINTGAVFDFPRHGQIVARFQF